MPSAIYQPGAGAAFTLSAFGDEIDADLDTQLRVMSELRIGFLELRAAWGTNVSDLDDRQVAGPTLVADLKPAAIYRFIGG